MSKAVRLEQFEFEHSLKNIPIGTQRNYMIRTYDRACKFVENVRWKAYWYLLKNKGKGKKSEETIISDSPGYFKFPTTRAAPKCPMLQPFEDELFDLIKSIKFRKVRTRFQNKLRSDIKCINDSKNVFVLSDKTGNIYQMDPADYKKLLHENITKDYALDSEDTLKSINTEAANLVARAQITGRIPKYSTSPAFLTIKDHKEGFPNNVKCRLVNPAKSHIGKVAKKLLDTVISDIRSKSNLVQWKNAYEVTKWFNNIEGKANKCFVKFDIVEFYPSIKEEYLKKALVFAKKFSNISDVDEDIIMHSCKTILTGIDGKIWRKKDSTSLFDIAMGSYHGAEVCDLLGLFILSKLAPILGAGTHGLYRDDGLAVLKGRTPSEWERLKKSIHRTFGDIGFRVTIETGLYRTDFLDVILDLRKNEYQPFRKANSKTVYINNESNHPRYIRSSLPQMIRKRISGLSKDRSIYDHDKAYYNEALKSSGLGTMGEFITDDVNARTKRRRRNVIFFHPPYCASVITKLGKAFLEMVDRHFPRHHKLRTIFNRSTLKISYSGLPNIKAAMQRHNHRVLRDEMASQPRMCNCGNRPCPVNNQCLARGTIYEATVTTRDEESLYIGSSCDTFKSRYNQHNSDFNDAAKRGKTALAGKIHDLKDAGTPYTIRWKILHKHTISERPAGRMCAVCNLERFAIAMADMNKCLNKRSELTSKCKHQKSCYL